MSMATAVAGKPFNRQPGDRRSDPDAVRGIRSKSKRSFPIPTVKPKPHIGGGARLLTPGDSCMKSVLVCLADVNRCLGRRSKRSGLVWQTLNIYKLRKFCFSK